MNILEVCCGSYQDCIVAYQAGAKRVELNSALSLGGLTPSLSTLKLVKQNTDLEVICMVRPRGFGFIYDAYEKEVCFQDAKLLLEHGCDGIAFGFLKEDATIDIEATKNMVNLIHSYNKTAVFHRAFDITSNPYQSIKELIDCHVDRVLTSGQEKNAWDGRHTIQCLQKQFGQQIEILPGCGITPKNAKDIIEYTHVTQIHSSCKIYKTDPTTSNEKVSFDLYGHCTYEVVDFNTVKDLLKGL